MWKRAPEVWRPHRVYGDTIDDEKEVRNSQVFIWSAFYAREEKMKKYAWFILLLAVLMLVVSSTCFAVQRKVVIEYFTRVT